MSEIYEAIVLGSELSDCQRAIARCAGGRRFRLHALGSIGTLVVVAADTRSLDRATFGEIARSLSEAGNPTLYLMYDNRTGVREAQLFQGGSLARTLGELDEFWVPVGEDGEPDRGAPRYSVGQLEKDVEYECIFSAIDAGLAAVGISEIRGSAQIKELACYPTEGEYVSVGQGEI